MGGWYQAACSAMGMADLLLDLGLAVWLLRREEVAWQAVAVAYALFGSGALLVAGWLGW